MHPWDRAEDCAPCQAMSLFQAPGGSRHFVAMTLEVRYDDPEDLASYAPGQIVRTREASRLSCAARVARRIVTYPAHAADPHRRRTQPVV
ncbi:hypothetical protein NCAST_25_02690 [Nocardia asteroides NBRC 15531]|uniref:Uncharacterized protein n=1 Tax=Nocardia asteroides NBRC 15531 TaxID=1110697 RepID=U5EEL7_NOCAS|nr:hypothetical protein NCAST_25_02690 [Nocardia asteroides NBRC 15531]